jgi:hypothetical protein
MEVKDRARNATQFSKDKLKSAVVRAADRVTSKSGCEIHKAKGDLMDPAEKVKSAIRK